MIRFRPLAHDTGAGDRLRIPMARRAALRYWLFHQLDFIRCEPVKLIEDLVYLALQDRHMCCGELRLRRENPADVRFVAGCGEAERSEATQRVATGTHVLTTGTVSEKQFEKVFDLGANLFQLRDDHCYRLPGGARE